MNDELDILQGAANPPHPTRGHPTRIWLAEVVTVNPDGTVDCRPQLSRGTRMRCAVPHGYTPQLKDMVLLTDLHGSPHTPIVITLMSR